VKSYFRDMDGRRVDGELDLRQDEAMERRRQAMKKMLIVSTLVVLFSIIVAVAQSPEVWCPEHHVTATATGASRESTEPNGDGTISKVIVYEYCDNNGNGHCFWGHN
jgi:hypothetical protein